MDIRQFNYFFELINFEEKTSKICNQIELAGIIKISSQAILNKKVNNFFADFIKQKQRELNKLTGTQEITVWDKIKMFKPKGKVKF